MNFTEKSDSEIIEIVSPMIDEVVQASNNKDWAIFSKYQTNEEASDPENRSNVESQWASSALLCSLNMNREILGVIRRDDEAILY